MSLLNNLPGSGQVKRNIIQYVDEQKKKYFVHEGPGYMLPSSPELAKAWKTEFDLCDCNSCMDAGCRCYMQDSRFPLDIGGQAQCLRLARKLSLYAFRNVDGQVIIIPDEIINAIREWKK